MKGNGKEIQYNYHHHHHHNNNNNNTLYLERVAWNSCSN